MGSPGRPASGAPERWVQQELEVRGNSSGHSRSQHLFQLTDDSAFPAGNVALADAKGALWQPRCPHSQNRSARPQADRSSADCLGGWLLHECRRVARSAACSNCRPTGLFVAASQHVREQQLVAVGVQGLVDAGASCRRLELYAGTSGSRCRCTGWRQWPFDVPRGVKVFTANHQPMVPMEIMSSSTPLFCTGKVDHQPQVVG